MPQSSSLDEGLSKLDVSQDLSFDNNFKSDFNINTVEFDVLLGSGGFGSVYRGEYEGKSVAVKVMHKNTKNHLAKAQSLKAEEHVLPFRHKNIVQVLAITAPETDPEEPWIVMEFVGYRNLLGIINDHQEILTTERRLKYSFQIASALRYSHEHFVVHLDLKPANVFITPDDDCKLGDFGCCQRVERDTGVVSPTERSVLTGTFAFRAPELLKGEAPTFAADIYSFGVTLWQLQTRQMPYANENQHVVIFRVVAYNLRPKIPPIDDSDPFETCYSDLYTQSWAANAEDRPSSSDLVDILKTWRAYVE